MTRIVSCYSNSFGPSGVWAAAESLTTIGLGHVELALRPHDFGGLVIPESAVITEWSKHQDVSRFRAFLLACRVEVSGCNVGGGDLRTAGGFEITARRFEG